MALGTGEKFGATFARDADGRILTNTTGGGTSTSGAALADATANPTTTGQAAFVEVFNGTTWDRIYSIPSTSGTTFTRTGRIGTALALESAGGTSLTIARNADFDNEPGANMLEAVAGLFNGSTVDRQRTPTTFKSFASTAITAGTGATVWTPTSGKKFRVMVVSISTSVAGQLILGDNAAGTVIARSPTLAAGAAWQLGAADLGNGILSAVANNVLKVDGPTGNVMGLVGGTEE